METYYMVSLKQIHAFSYIKIMMSRVIIFFYASYYFLKFTTSFVVVVVLRLAYHLFVQCSTLCFGMTSICLFICMVSKLEVSLSTLDSSSFPTTSFFSLDLEEVEVILGYKLSNKHLLEEDFTHNSYDADTYTLNEFLEYIGDTLSLLITKGDFSSIRIWIRAIRPDYGRRLSTMKSMVI